PGPAALRVSLVMMVAVRVAAAVVAAFVLLTQKGRAMLAAIEGMIAELRQTGVPVSLAERIDAMQSLRHLPVGDRATVKAALRAVLVKTHDHELAFDAVFDLYFTAQPGQAGSAQENSQAAPGQDGQEAQDGLGVQGGLSGQNGHGGGGLGTLDTATLTELLLT